MKFIFVALKLILSAFFLWVVFQQVDFKHVFLLIGQKPFLLITAVALFLIQSLLAGFRLPPILSIYGSTATPAECIRIWLVGLFTSQILVTFIAGDAFRVWLLRKKDIPLQTATKAIVFDRLFGLVILLCLSLLSALILLTHPFEDDIRTKLWVISALCGVFLIGFTGSPLFLKMLFILPDFLRNHKVFIAFIDLISIAKTGFECWSPTLKTSIMGLIMHVLNAVILWVILRQLGQDISFFTVALITFPIILLTLLPISFAGWGVRESAMIAGLALFGVPSATAMATSLIYGLCLLLSSLPGGIILFRILWQKKKPVQDLA